MGEMEGRVDVEYVGQNQMEHHVGDDLLNREQTYELG